MDAPKDAGTSGDEPRNWALTELLGRQVRAHDGHLVGHLEDVTVHLGASHPELARISLRTGHHSSALVTWSAVQRIATDALVLAEGVDVSPGSADPRLHPSEILLRRDVLDTQVVDLQGLRLSRVADVLLAQRDDGTAEVAAVQLGLKALLPRLGLGWVVKRWQQPAVDWRDLHLTSPRAHAAQLATNTAGYHRLDAAGLASLLSRLSMGHATDVLQSIDPERAATAVQQSHPLIAGRLVQALGPGATPPDPSPLGGRRFRRTAGWRRLTPVGPAPLQQLPVEPHDAGEGPS